MNKPPFALPILALALLTAGCAWLPTSGPDGTVSHFVSPAPPGVALKAQILVPTPGLRDSRPSSWVTARPDGPDRLLVTFWGSPCLAVDRVDVADGIRTVVVTLFLGSKAGFGDVCPDIAVYQGVHVSLIAPLGGRRVVDGAAPQTPEPPGTGGFEPGSPPDGTG